MLQRCPQCKLDLPEDAYSPRVWGNNGEFCRLCRNAYTRQWRLENHEKTKALQRNSYHKAIEKEPRLNRRRRLKAKYGLSLEDVDQMLSAQGRKCLGCFADFFGDDFCVDHNHLTGRTRGLLCTCCNTALGHAKDNPAILRRLANYVENT